MERVKTPILWSDCILPGLFLYFGFQFLWTVPFKGLPVFLVALNTCVLVALFFPGTFHILEHLHQYTFNPEGLTVYVLGIKVRQIHWSEISYAIYCYTWRDPFLPPADWKTLFTPTFDHPKGQMIFVTMDTADPFDPKHHWRWWHRLTHLGSSLCIFLPRSNVTVYTDAFRKYYPKMERQSVEKSFG